jgi:hypothetical protein
LKATRVELKDPVFQTDISEVELRGTIAKSNFGQKEFDLEGFPGITIDASQDPEFDDIEKSDIAKGAFVEVKGTCPDPDCLIIVASRIQGESEGFDDDEGEVEIEGFITRYVDDSDFDVDGLPVDASTAEIKSSVPLTVDLRVEVEGTVVNNVLMASKVELEDD